MKTKKQYITKLGLFYALCKPGIIRGNVLTATAGFYLASESLNLELYLSTLVGISFVIASACVLNNCIDREIDSKMSRTKKRALANGSVSVNVALAYSAILGAGGFLILGFMVSAQAFMLAGLGFLIYVVAYGWAKRCSVYGTEVGSISGAIPPVVGYVAAAGHLDIGALLLFVIVVVWQMPHFYAISIYRQADYAAAGMPVSSIDRGVPLTKQRMLAYIAAFIPLASSLTFFGYTGIAYMAVAFVAGALWLAIGLHGLDRNDDTKWAKQMFLASLAVIFLLSVMIPLGNRLP